jgi:hypothetical protein
MSYWLNRTQRRLCHQYLSLLLDGYGKMVDNTASLSPRLTTSKQRKSISAKAYRLRTACEFLIADVDFKETKNENKKLKALLCTNNQIKPILKRKKKKTPPTSLSAPKRSQIAMAS